MGTECFVTISLVLFIAGFSHWKNHQCQLYHSSQQNRLWQPPTRERIRVRLIINSSTTSKPFSAYSAYALSKLYMHLMTFHMARKLKGASPVTANTLHPGVVNTKMLDSGWGPVGTSVDDADDEFLLATDDSVSSVSGKYFLRHRITDPPSIANDVTVQDRLIGILEEQTGEVFSPVKVWSSKQHFWQFWYWSFLKLQICTLSLTKYFNDSLVVLSKISALFWATENFRINEVESLRHSFEDAYLIRCTTRQMSNIL